MLNLFRHNISSQRIIEGQNWIIIATTVVIAYYNYERVRIARIALPYTIKQAENGANTLNKLEEINKKIKPQCVVIGE